MEPSDAAKRLYEDSEKPPADFIRQRASVFGTPTKYGGMNFNSVFSARSATRTAVVSGDPDVERYSNMALEDPAILRDAHETAAAANRHLSGLPKGETIGVERTIGRGSPIEGRTRLLLSLHENSVVWSGEKNMRLAQALDELVFPMKPQVQGGHMVVYVPEFGERPQIIYFADRRTHYILGDDYTGELWKSNARDVMWHSQQQGLLPMHAGTQLVDAYDEKERRMKRYVLAFFGLSKTGKSTRSCNDNGLDKPGESVKIKQDDIASLNPDTGEIYGTSNSFYCVTEGLNPAHQRVLYNAAIQPDVTFENATLTEDGDIVFDEQEIKRLGGCQNPRALLHRQDFGMHYDKDINTPGIDWLDGIYFIFITRDYTIMPFISELSPEQLGQAYILGETIDSPATTKDQTKWGKPKREPGTDPFTPGNPAYRANMLYGFHLGHPGKVRGFLINTGGVGGDPETGRKDTAKKIIQINEMTEGVKSILRNTAEFTPEEYFGAHVLVSADGLDFSRWLPQNFYSAGEYAAWVGRRKESRRQYAERYKGLDREIAASIGI